MRPRLTLFLIAALTCVLSTGARAQDFSTNVISERERDAVLMTLELDDEQVKLLDQLAEVYDAQCADIVAAHEKRGAELMEFVGTDGQVQAIKDFIQLRYDTQQSLDEKQRAFMDEVELLLTAEQQPLLERCRWRLTRLQLLQDAGDQISGLSADPMIVARNIGLPELLLEEERESYEDAMFRYDRTVALRLKEIKELQSEFVIAFTESPDLDPGTSEMLELSERAIKLVLETRDVHNDRAHAIAVTLPEDLRPVWEAEWQRQAFPDVYRPTWSEQTFERLLALDTVPDEHRARIEALRDGYAERIAPLRDAWADAIEDAEEDFDVEQAFTMAEISSDDIRNAIERVTDLDRSIRRRLLDILPDTLDDRIPPLPADAPSPNRPR